MSCDCTPVIDFLTELRAQCNTTCGIGLPIDIYVCEPPISMMVRYFLLYTFVMFLGYKCCQDPDNYYDGEYDDDDDDDDDYDDDDDDYDDSETELDSYNESYELSDLTVFGMTGRKRSGKDTSGDRLVNEHGFVRIAFADALKEACIDVFGFSWDQVYGDDLKEVVDDYWEYSPREVLQKVGTELFREVIAREDVLPKIGENIWVRTVERKIMNLAKQGYRRFVITDVRFDNELDFLKQSEFNAISIKVVRSSAMTETDPSKLHASEALIDSFDCDFEVNNDSTIEDLYTGIDQIVGMICKD